MTRRAVFLADGPSDLPLADLLAAMCLERGLEIAVTAIDPGLLRDAGRTVEGRLRFLIDEGDRFDLAFVHRDAEAQEPDLRRREISDGAAACGVTAPVVPVVPIRMTEAWLLLDDQAIREVAGRPRDTTPLDLPGLREVERMADPKKRLVDTLLVASGASGRRRANFTRDFGRHRALLLRRLDRFGPVSSLAAWKQLEADLDDAVAHLSRSTA